MFNNKENEEIPPEKPRMKIGKLDPRSLFDKGQERQTAVVQEKEMYNNVVIGKLNTKNIFENDQVREVEKQTVQVGRINNKVSWTRVLGHFMYSLGNIFPGSVPRKWEWHILGQAVYCCWKTENQGIRSLWAEGRGWEASSADWKDKCIWPVQWCQWWKRHVHQSFCHVRNNSSDYANLLWLLTWQYCWWTVFE